MPDSLERRTYRPSGRVSWGAILPLVALTFVGAAAMAGVMYWLFARGWYLLFIVPIFGALVEAGLLRFAVGAGKCRAPLIARLLGFAAGAVMYVGYYYIGMVASLGVESIWRVDLFPDYVSWRMH